MTDRLAELPAILERIAREHAVPGAAAAAIVDGTVAREAVHGLRDVARGLPVTPSTRFRWYSISKPLTALALLQAAEDRLLDLDEPLTRHLPDLRFADPVATERATARDCLLHRTGLSGGEWTWHLAPPDPSELLRRLPHLPCRQGFRAGFHYQNLHFTILGELLRAAGRDWHLAMRALLAPLGVAPATTLPAFAAGERALGYGPNALTPPEPQEDEDFAGAPAASAVCGTIGELARVAAACARSGAYDGDRWISQRAWAEAVRPVLCQAAPEWPELRQPGAALAGRVVVYRGEPLLQWAGGWRGYVSHMLVLPERRTAACALANRTSSAAAEAIAFATLDRAAGFEPLPWPERFLTQKQRLRRRGGARLAERLARPAASWPCAPADAAGRFRHPAYGEIEVVIAGSGARLRFRNADLPLVPRDDGTFSADGSTVDAAELSFDLRPALSSGRVAAWSFNPDDPAAPLTFARSDGRSAELSDS